MKRAASGLLALYAVCLSMCVPAFTFDWIEDAGHDVVTQTDVPTIGDVMDVPSVPEILPPRLIAPLSASSVTTQRPTLRWVLPPGFTGNGVRIQICSDRACTQVVREFDGTGQQAQPPVALGAGMLFWRVFGRNDAVIGSEASATWQMTIPSRDSIVDSTHGGTLDLNGDGFADTAIASPAFQTDAGRVYVYHGSSSGPGASPSVMLSSSAGARAGTSVAAAGDVNGDGFGDLIVGAPGTNSDAGRVSIYFGRSNGIATSADVTLEVSGVPASRFGAAVAGVGDVNADGYADVVVGAPMAAAGRGAAYLFYGGPTGPAMSPSLVLDAPSDTDARFGSSIAGCGDMDGDRDSEIAVSAPGLMGGAGGIFIFLGSTQGAVATPMFNLMGASGSMGRMGAALAGGGDVNGDGYADLLVGLPGERRARLVIGNASGPSDSGVALMAGTTGNEFGASMAMVGDANGDGFGDLVAGAPGAGTAYVFHGASTGLNTIAATTLTRAAAGFAVAIASGGDINRDGFSEIVIGANVDQSAFVFSGSSGGVGMAPRWSLTAPETGDFGAAVAWFDRAKPWLVGSLERISWCSSHTESRRVGCNDHGG